MKRSFFLFWLSLVLPLTLPAQWLTPFPKKVQLTSDTLIFTPSGIKATTLNTSTFNQELALGIFEDAGIAIHATGPTGKLLPQLIIDKPGSAEDLKISLQSSMLDDTFNTGAEGYIIDISPTSIHLMALTDAGIFYGLQTLRQLFQNYDTVKLMPCMTIYDKPDIKVRAWQDDISRGPVPSMDMLKQQIKTMASFKLNYFTLYTEHVFKLDGHPGIAPDDGITKAQINELSRFARDYQVTLIGNYQSFGHMEKTLGQPAYRHLLENGHIINPALDESYAFLASVYEEVAPAYSSDYFHINCDETFGLGTQHSKAMVDSLGLEAVYAFHINKLDGLLKKYNKKILMWGDIAGSYPDIVAALPPDITVVVWAYHAADDFIDVIGPIAGSGLKFWVAPGISGWSNVYPDVKTAEINIYNLIRDGYKLNAGGVLNTSWDDDGLNFLNDGWHGFAWGAENSWNAPPDLEQTASEMERERRYAHFNQAFDVHFWGLNKPEESITAIINKFASLHHSGIRDVLKNSRFFEPVFPIHAEYVQKGKAAENSAALSMLDSLYHRLTVLKPGIKYNEPVADYLLFAIKRAQFTLKKNLYRFALSEYLNNGTPPSDKAALKQQKSSLIDTLTALKRAYTLLWAKENRPYWLNVNEHQFDKLIQSLISLDGYVLFEPSNHVDPRGREVVMRSVFNEYPIHYTINADTVTLNSPIYKVPIFIKEDAIIRARSINDTIALPVQQISLIHHKGIGKLIGMKSVPSDYHPAYDGGGQYALLDGRTGDPGNLWSGLWQGFSGQDIELELDLRNTAPLHSFSMGFYQNTDIWVIFPKQVEIYTKTTPEDAYRLFTTIEGSIPPETKGSLKEQYTASLRGMKPAIVKVVARHYGKLPAWHPAGSAYDSMIFADEIILK